MASMDWLTPDRRKSLGGGILGMSVAIVLILALPGLLPTPSRETAVAAALLAPALTVFGLTLAVSAGRFGGRRFDPLTDQESRYIAVSQRSLTNSVEQGLVFALAASALAWTAGPEWLSVVPALALTFVVARLAFWLGYLKGPFIRPPGMAGTLITNLVTVALAVWQAFGG
ncbi:MAPEG family protein [Ferruginivarius sediminum]|uniref:MAPEG family protein n=1 Tax=Ferruginivarius sediminum TaxID=2661937 RepID=A0A369T9X6_9PROT|nr:MAPEG family protein [Ferruginivarius sediminum]RDD60977.1 MAPEG family protein [Ferruginivarius sediminum]